MLTKHSRFAAGWLCTLCLAMAGCYEVQALLTREPPADNDAPTSAPTDDADQNAEEAYGPFPPADDDADASGEDTTTEDDADADADVDVDTSGEEVNTNGEDSVADDNAEPTLAPLPDDAVIETLESGLQVHDFEVGDGASPESRAASVVVDYAGYIQETGRQFDSGESVSFGLSGVIDGFAEGILGMNVGGRRRIIIPPDLGYGENGNAGAGIAGDDVIVFDVTLISIN